MARIADDRAGVDYTTLGILQPLAKAVLAREPHAEEALARAASARAEELRKHKRVNPSSEPLRFFCGVLRLIFNQAAAPALKGQTEKAWHHCRHFAMECSTSPASSTRILTRIRNGRPSISVWMFPSIDGRRPPGFVPSMERLQPDRAAS